VSALDYAPLARAHLAGVMELCDALDWPSYARDADTTWRALTCPGATSWVALDGEHVVGLAHILGDGAIQAHLSLIGVLESQRRRGVGRALLERAFPAAGGQWLDLVSDPGAEPFYRSLPHEERVGFRVYPGR
jgi:GNAT superfamily N-acetyltransferase